MLNELATEKNGVALHLTSSGLLSAAISLTFLRLGSFYQHCHIERYSYLKAFASLVEALYISAFKHMCMV